MARQQLHHYTFTPATNTIVITDQVVPRERFLMIANTVTNQVMYIFSDQTNPISSYSFDATAGTTTLVLTFDCSAMNANDVLTVFIDQDYQTIEPSPTFTDAVSKMRVVNPQNLIDTDFEYGLQSTKWETLELVKNIPTFFSRSGDIGLGLASVTRANNSDAITVTTNETLTVVVGTPIIVQGTSVISCNGSFVVTRILGDYSFQYRAKQVQNASGIINDTYTQVYIASVYQGTEFELTNVNSIVTDGVSPNSTITLNTAYPTNFEEGTSFFLTNTVGAKEVTFDSSNIETNNVTTYSITAPIASVQGNSERLSNTTSYAYGAIDPYNEEPAVHTIYFVSGHPTPAENTVTISSNQLTFPVPHNLSHNKTYMYEAGEGNAGLVISGTARTLWPFTCVVVDDYTIEMHVPGSTSNQYTVTAPSSFAYKAKHSITKAYRMGVYRGRFRYTYFFSASNIYFTWNDDNDTPVRDNLWSLSNGDESGYTASWYNISGSSTGLTVYGDYDRLHNQFFGSAGFYYAPSTVNNGNFNSFSTFFYQNYYTGYYNGNSNYLVFRKTNPRTGHIYIPDHNLEDRDTTYVTLAGSVPSRYTNDYNNLCWVQKYDDNWIMVVQKNLTGEQRFATFGSTATTAYTIQSDPTYNRGATINTDAHRIAANDHQLLDGQSVTYQDQGGTPIGGLIDGQTYYVSDARTNSLKLATTDTVESAIEFNQNSVSTSNTLTYTDYINMGSAHGLVTGDAVRYLSDTPIAGLRNEGVYYVRYRSTTTIYLYFDQASAIAGGPGNIVSLGLGPGGSYLTGTGTLTKVYDIDLTSAGVGTQALESPVQGAADGVYTISNVVSPTQYEMTTTGIVPNRVKEGDQEAVVYYDEDSFYFPTHGYLPGQEVNFSTDGTAPSGLTNLTDYYVIRVNRDWIQLAASFDDATSDPPVPVTITNTGSGTMSLTSSDIAGEAVGGGTLTVAADEVTITGTDTSFDSFFKTGDQITVYGETEYNNVSVTGFSSSSDYLTVASAQTWNDGDLVYLTGTAAPGGLTLNKFYYTRQFSATQWQMFPTRADALANTNIIQLTSFGTAAVIHRIGTINSSEVLDISFVNSAAEITTSVGPSTSYTDAEYALTTSVLIRADGFAIHRPYDGGVELTPSTNPDSQMIRQTRRYFRYQSGKGIQVSYAVNFSPSTQIDTASIASGDTVVTATTRYPHRMSDGLLITVSGFDTVSGVDYFNATSVAVSVTDEYTFTYDTAGTAAPANLSGPGFGSYYVDSWNNSALRCGLYDDQNGLYYEYNGSTLFVCRRRSTTQLSGTLAVTFNSPVVTGTNTRFTSQVNAGDRIVVRGMSYLVTSVSSDSLMYILPSYRGVTASNVIGSITQDVKVPQSQWNIDTCDGTGPSGYTLNIHAIQMAYIDYSWYGAGKARFGFKMQDGTVRYVHEFVHNNQFTEAYLRSGNLPGRYDIENIGIPTYVPALAHWGTSVIMDGGFDDDKAYLFTATGNDLSVTGAASLTETGRAETTDYYEVQISSRWYRIGHAIELQNTDGTLNGLTAGQVVTGANLGAGTKLANPYYPWLSYYGYPDQPYHPSITTRINGNNSTIGTRNLVLIDPAPTGSTVSYSTYTFTLGTASSPVIYDQPLISIRLSPSVDTNTPGYLGERELLNRMQLALQSVGILATHACQIRLVLNGQLNTNSWQLVSNPSLSQLLYHTTEDTVIGGTSLYDFRAQGGTGTTGRTPVTTEQVLQEVANLGNSIMGGDGVYPDGPDVLTIVARLSEDPSTVSTTNPFNVTGRITWTESQA